MNFILDGILLRPIGSSTSSEWAALVARVYSSGPAEPGEPHPEWDYLDAPPLA